MTGSQVNSGFGSTKSSFDLHMNNYRIGRCRKASWLKNRKSQRQTLSVIRNSSIRKCFAITAPENINH